MSPRGCDAFDEGSGDSGLELGGVPLHAGDEVPGAPMKDRIESEQHDRGERIEELRSSRSETDRQVDEAAAVEQVQPSAVHLKPFEMSTQLGVGMQIKPVDVDLTRAMADVHEDRAVGEALDLCRSDYAVETGRGDYHAGSANGLVEVGDAAPVVLREDQPTGTRSTTVTLAPRSRPRSATP